MIERKMEEMSFRPRLPFVRLAVACLAFGVLGWAFVNEQRAAFQLAGRPTPGMLAEAFGVGLFLLACFGFITSFLLLQFRLRFKEAGIRRLTLFGPRFIPWGGVCAARVGSYKGYFVLELWVSRRRWVCVPLPEYAEAPRLLAEIKKRLPVEVQASEKQLALLGDV